ncbi:alpha amylase family protein [Chitinophaga japonensis]|uniref:Glycosyl hydrolase family 10 n=1 Tax=Chitinophaga japonensis TaxID=104662 RepID=A0A562TGT7_CHIJA|nr:alpha amylase family protein [Chitinophaga japonensis]TWI92388.1 glycosyl hydrolase family 10 [Chitinophaga japonensis]
MNKSIFIYLLYGGLLMGAACKKSGTADPAPVPPEDSSGVITPGRNVLVWVDARSNVFGTYGRLNDTNEIKKVLDTLKETGVTGLVIDVKGTTGYTMYPSAYAAPATEMDGKSLPAGLDYAGYMIREARKRSFRVYASIVTFVEGDGNRGIGKVFDDPAFRSEYETIVCDVNGNRVPVTSTGRNAFVNPARPEIQERALNIIREIAGKYDIDGLLLDYARYTSIDADFSDFSKQQFINFLEEKYNDSDAAGMNFPTDIVASWKTSSGKVVPATTGKYYKKWLLYRAGVLRDFFEKARAAVKSVKPAVEFGAYVGAWYVTYYEVGVNWASQDYDPFNDQQVRFDWAYPGYNETGYAEQLDILLTGNYFTQILLSENPATASLQYHWWSVEGSIKGTRYITRDKMPLYGSIDMGNVDWPNKGEITRAIKYIMANTTGGIMLFDLVHIYAPQYNRLKQPLWDAVKEGIKP